MKETGSNELQITSDNQRLGIADELDVACEQALLFGRVKRVSRERASKRGSREGRSREACFACPNRRACSQAKFDVNAHDRRSEHA